MDNKYVNLETNIYIMVLEIAQEHPNSQSK